MSDSLYQFATGNIPGAGAGPADAPWQDATAANTPAMPQGADPFAGAGNNGQPSFWQRAGNFLQSQPAQDAFQNLTRFGAATLAAANARTPQGFLAYGSGAGPIGAGLLQAGQIGREQQELQGRLGLQQAQTQGQYLQNQLTGMTLPYLMQQYQQLGQPNNIALPGLGGEAATGGPPPPVAPSSASSSDFLIPESARPAMLAQATAGTPVPPALVNAIVTQESGWKAGATGKAGDIGLGQIMPPTAQNPGFGMAGVDPASITGAGGAQRNLNFTAQYAYARGKAAGLTDQDFANPQKWPIVAAAYHSGVDNPKYAASVMAIAQGGQQQQAQAQEAQAPQQQQAAPLQGPSISNIPPSVALDTANKLDLRAHQEALLSRIPGQKEAAERDAALAAQYRSYALDPSKAGAVAQAQVAPHLAEAAGKAPIAAWQKWHEPIIGRGPGSFVLGTNPDGSPRVVAQAPVEVPAVGPHGEPGHTFVQPMAAEAAGATAPGAGVAPGTPGGGGGGPPVTGGRGAPPPGAPGSFIPSGLAPGQLVAQKEAAENFAGPEEAKRLGSAQATMQSIEQMEHAADMLNSNGWTHTGPGVAGRVELQKAVNSISQIVGKNVFDPNPIASYEELTKATTTAGFQLANSYLGAQREAATTIMNATSAVPHATNSPQGFKLVANGIKEAAQQQIDLSNFRTNWYRENKGDMVAADNAFYQGYPPAMYARRAISQVQPYPVKTPNDAKRYLPGTMVKLPDGSTAVVPGPTGIAVAGPAAPDAALSRSSGGY